MCTVCQTKIITKKKTIRKGLLLNAERNNQSRRVLYIEAGPTKFTISNFIFTISNFISTNKRSAKC